MHTKISNTLRNTVRLGIRLVIFIAVLALILRSALPAIAAPRVVSVAVGAQTGALTAGTAGNATYVISVVKGTTSSLTLSNLAVTGGLPAGATASFSPANLSWTAAETGAKTSTLTIHTTAATPGGSTTFTVRAVRSGSSGDNATGNGTLNIAIVQQAPTITFGTPPTPTYLSGNFIVAATTNSNGALTYSAVSGPCAVVNTSLGIFSSSGAGACVVGASTAATVNFSASSVQQSVTIAPATPTLIFGPDPYPIFPGGNFTVVATTNSDGARTYGVVSGPCTLVDANAGSFSPTGLGACVVQANTAATTNFLARSVQRTATIIAPGFDLYAVAGSTTLPDGANIPIWGYTADGAPATQPGGPTLVVNQGDIVSIILHNSLGEATSLLIQGQTMVPDRTGAPSNGTKNYAFTADHAGTYLYEAGLLPNAQHQVAMGLYGALIVRPATAGQAYAATSTAYNDEAVLVLSELDPALSANPAGFDLRNYKPKYWLINGRAYANTAPPLLPTGTLAGNKVLLRYVNAGLQHHSMAALGLNQTVIAMDGSPLTYAHRMVAETIAPGQTADTIVTVPTGAVAGSKFALYDGNLQLNNSNTAGFSGMLTFLSIAADASGPDTVGPVTFAPALAPNPTNGTVDIGLSASVSDAATGNATVAAAEYFIDTIGANGTGVALTGAFATPTEAVLGTIPVASLTGLAAGNHTVFVHGRDNAGNWGATNFVVLNLDKSGPATIGFLLGPNPSNGSVDVTLSATGDDSTTGNSNIAAAEYTLDGGAAQPMTVNNTTTPIASLAAVIPAATVNGLSQGAHTVTVRSQDALGNWGAVVQKNLLVDKTGPTTSNVIAAPNPNNGTTGLSLTQAVVRVTAQFDDASVGAAAQPEAAPSNTNAPAANHIYLPLISADPLATTENDVDAAAVIPGTSYVKTAEGFIDTVGVTGAGFPFVASDGLFDELSEIGYADIPLTTINGLSVGNHTIYVHSQDGAGNWGPTIPMILVIDKAAPTVSGITLTPAVTNNTPVVISGAASDVATGNSNIAGGEYFIDNNTGAAGTGTLMTASPTAPSSTLNATIPAAMLAPLTEGSHTVYVRAKDAAGNWSALVNVTLRIDRTAPTISNATVSPNPTNAATTISAIVTASDNGGGSGLNGGVYWIDGSATTTPVGAISFSGTTSPITVNGISVSALTAGSHNLRVRVRDVAGNFSAVRTVAFTVSTPPPDAIFSDGFESPTTLPGNWTSRSTGTTSRLNNTTTAALVGARGLQAQGDNTNYVQFDFGTTANPATATYDARFYFNPHANTGANQDILVARTTGGATVFRVRYRWNGGAPQVQIQVGPANTNALWTNITNNASNRIEVVWQSGVSLQLFVGASTSSAQSLTATVNLVGSVRMGSVAGSTSNILEYFDAFSSKRSTTPFGP
ncbi:MAG: multicopper oxidase domain-containing protein [Chloroflexi bacterium]|nr:multicopper oxidase domain-containing protein [Chloroflexota bacterium]